MKNKTIIFLLLISFVGNYSFADEKIPKNETRLPSALEIMQKVSPLFTQNMRSFDSINCDFLREQWNPKTEQWEKKSKNQIIWNIKKKEFKATELVFIHENTQEMGKKEFLFLNNKFFKTESKCKYDSNFSVDTTTLKEQTCQIYSGDLGVFDILSHFRYIYFLYISGYQNQTSIFDIMMDADSSSIHVVDKGVEWEVHMLSQVLTIDKQKGVILKSESKISGNAEKKIMSSFFQIDGWCLPTVVTIDYHNPFSKYGYTRERYTLDASTLKINKPILPVNFSITLKEGAHMIDNIKGLSYRLEIPFSSIEIESVEKSLKELINKSKREKK